jgi:hypothetical protein
MSPGGNAHRRALYVLTCCAHSLDLGRSFSSICPEPVPRHRSHSVSPARARLLRRPRARSSARHQLPTRVRASDSESCSPHLDELGGALEGRVSERPVNEVRRAQSSAQRVVTVDVREFWRFGSISFSNGSFGRRKRLMGEEDGRVQIFFVSPFRVGVPASFRKPLGPRWRSVGLELCDLRLGYA